MTTFRISSADWYKDVYEYVKSKYNKTRTMALISELKHSAKEPYYVETGGKKTSLDEFIAPKKITAFTSDEASRLLALFICDPEHLRNYFSSIPDTYLKLMNMLVRRKYISLEELKSTGFESCLEENYRKYFYYDLNAGIAKHKIWFQTVTAYDRSQGAYKRTVFFSLDRSLVWIVNAGMLTPDERDPYVTDIPAGFEIFDAEKEAFAAFPVLQGLIRQNALKFSEFKVTQASSFKVMKQLPIRELVPPNDELNQKYNLGQMLFPYINHSLGKSANNYSDVARKAFKCLSGYYVEESIQNLLPFVKGFRATAMRRYAWGAVINFVRDTVLESSDRWIDVDKLTMKTIDVQDTISPRGFDEMELENNYYGEYLSPSDITSQIEKPLIQAFLSVIYGLGGMTLACESADPKFAITPFGHVRFAKLNDFGRYIVGLTDSYQSPAVEQKKLFSIDDRHLVIRSLEPGNPYESLLMDTAVPVGGGRYKMSPESFLSKCKSKKDVDEKVAFFKEYVCSDLPKNWEDFFATIARRCKPFVKDTTKFYMLKLDPSDKDLALLLSTDEVLKNIIVKAEGYRLLIPVEKETLFNSRLKQFGYLV